MKRISLLTLTILIMLAVLSGCTIADEPVNSPSAGRISVVSTIFAPYDFVREIAGGRVDAVMLLPPAAESHSFEPTPQDIILIGNCDVFIYVGGESDSWVDRILESMDTANIKTVRLMDCVNIVEEEIVEGMDADTEEDAEYDEHVWTSPENAKLIVQQISEALCEADAVNEEEYALNTAAYLAKLDELDASLRAVISGAARNTIVFGDRFPFRYFADAYGLNYYAAFPGCSSATEANAKTITFLIDKVNDEKIPIIFHAELSNEKIAETISEATGAKVMLLHACHNISKDDFQNGVSYLDLMLQNLEALKEALY